MGYFLYCIASNKLRCKKNKQLAAIFNRALTTICNYVSRYVLTPVCMSFSQPSMVKIINALCIEVLSVPIKGLDRDSINVYGWMDGWVVTLVMIWSQFPIFLFTMYPYTWSINSGCANRLSPIPVYAQIQTLYCSHLNLFTLFCPYLDRFVFPQKNQTYFFVSELDLHCASNSFLK